MLQLLKPSPLRASKSQIPSLRAAAPESLHTLERVFYNRSHRNEKPILSTTRESPHAAVKIQCSKKKKKSTSGLAASRLGGHQKAIPPSLSTSRVLASSSHGSSSCPPWRPCRCSSSSRLTPQQERVLFIPRSITKNAGLCLFMDESCKAGGLTALPAPTSLQRLGW